MALVKKTEEGQSWRLERIKELEGRREKIKTLAALKDTLEWRALSDILDSFVKFAEREEKIALRDCRKNEHDDHDLVKRLRECAQKQDDFKMILDLVNDSESQMNHLNEAIKQAKYEYKEASAELA